MLQVTLPGSAACAARSVLADTTDSVAGSARHARTTRPAELQHVPIENVVVGEALAME